MSYYKRVVYMDYYDNEEKVSNAGFIKLMKMVGKEEERTCLQIHIMNLPLQNVLCGTVKLVLEARECLLGRMNIENGRGMLQIKNVEEALRINGCVWENWEDGHMKIELGFEKIIRCDLQNKRMESLAEVESTSCQRADVEEPREAEQSDGNNMEQNVIDRQEDKAEEQETNFAQKEKTEDSERVQIRPKRGMRMKRDKWSQLWEMLPHIRPFGDEREYLQIALQDLLVLSAKHYRLADNSFLLHGFYNYEHLILTRMTRRGVEKYYLGVPGNYYEREKQVAVWFGFESFEPKAEPATEGDFGYYLIGVEI